MLKYLLSVISAAIVSAVTVSLFENNSILKSTVKLLSGLFLSITVISPFINWNFNTLPDFRDSMQNDVDRIVESGKCSALEEKRTIITDQLEAYILDEATALGVDAEVSIQLSDSEPPIPCSVVLAGAFSPYARATLEQTIVRELGIPKEQQEWK